MKLSISFQYKTLMKAFGFLAKIFPYVLVKREDLGNLQRDATIDPLTGLGNRRVFQEALTKAYAGADRHHRRFAVLMVDIDNMKAHNGDSHMQGDRAIKTVGEILSQSFRAGDDTVTRLGAGSDEFAVIMDCRSAYQTRKVAERICKKATDAGVPVTIGFAVYRPCTRKGGADVYDKASRVLLMGKQVERGRVYEEKYQNGGKKK